MPGEHASIFFRFSQRIVIEQEFAKDVRADQREVLPVYANAFSKLLLQGTQSHLDFLPEAQTDFIIAVIAEELGFMGVIALLFLYLLIIARGLFLAINSESTFGRLLSGALILTFFVYVFVNIAMVSGLLPVVGVPLPLVSYGGTSAITLMAGFGLIMAIRTHKAW